MHIWKTNAKLGNVRLNIR